MCWPTLLADRGDQTAVTELRTRADTGDDVAQGRLAWLLATRGDEAALTELRTRADTGDDVAQGRLAELLATRGDEAALTVFRPAPTPARGQPRAGSPRSSPLAATTPPSPSCET